MDLEKRHEVTKSAFPEPGVDILSDVVTSSLRHLVTSSLLHL